MNLGLKLLYNSLSFAKEKKKTRGSCELAVGIAVAPVDHISAVFNRVVDVNRFYEHIGASTIAGDELPSSVKQDDDSWHFRNWLQSVVGVRPSRHLINPSPENTKRLLSTGRPIVVWEHDGDNASVPSCKCDYT